MAVIRQEDLNLLNAAAKSTDVTVVEEALRNAADKNCREIGGYEFTALHRAIYSNESIAWVLVKEPGVCLNEKDTLGHTPLHLAWRGCVPLMEKYCTTKEVLWDLEDNIGQTPLLYHARLGNDTSLKALLRRTEVSISKITMDGFTALHQVVEQDRRFLPHWRELLSADKRCELVGILLDMKMEKARIERAFQRKSVEAEDLESDVLDFVNTKDVLNRSVLHYIAEEGCVAILDKLLKWFAVKEVKDRVDVTTLDVHGCAPLLLAVQRGHRDMVRELLKLKQIDPNVPATVIESRPSELKPYEENHKQLCRPNLFSKAPTEQYSGTDITPLHFAVNVKPQFEVAAALLLDERTKIVDNERWEMFDKVLCLAEGPNDKTTANELLIKLEKSINRSNYVINQSFAHLELLITIAAIQNRHRIIRHIFKWKPEVNANIKSKLADNSGLVATPLHFAVKGMHVDAIRALLTHLPLDPNVQDSSSRIPLQIAAASNNNVMKDIEKLLMERAEVKNFVDRLYKEKQDSVTNANAFLVIATFVASAAFTSWLQPPRGYTSNESDVAVKEHPILQAFVLFNGCSFFFAIATILASTYVTMLSLQQAFIGDVVESMKKTRIIASILLSICIFCVLGSFATAGFAVLPPSIEYNWSMWATVIIIIGIVCVMLRVAFIRKL